MKRAAGDHHLSDFQIIISLIFMSIDQLKMLANTLMFIRVTYFCVEGSCDEGYTSNSLIQ